MVRHRMFMCPKGQHLQKYAFTILYRSQAIPQVNGRQAALTWQQYIMGSRLLRKFCFAKQLWSLIHGSIIWIIWIDRNAICFQHEVWANQKLELMLWEAVFNHGRTAQYCTQSLIKQHLDAIGKFITQFSDVWCQSYLLSQMEAGHMCWNLH